MAKQKGLWIVWAGTVCLMGALSAPATGEMTVLFRTGDIAPDGAGRFADFYAPVINNFGDIAFTAGLDLDSNGTRDGSGVCFVDRDATASMIQRVGQAAPGVWGGNFAEFADVRLNDAGDIACSASLDDLAPGLEHTAMATYMWRDGVIDQVVRSGAVVPGGGANFEWPVTPSMNQSGQLAFAAGLTGSATATTGIYRYDAGALITIAQGGDAGPITGGDFHRTPGPAVINNAGQVAFDATLTGSAVSFGLFRADVSVGGSVSYDPIALDGELAPEPPATEFHSFLDYDMDPTDAPTVVFNAVLDGEALYGVYRAVTAGTYRIRNEGAEVPDTTARYFTYFDSLDIVDGNQFSFIAHSENRVSYAEHYTAIYQWTTRLVETGDTAPDGNGEFDVIHNQALNNSDVVLFEASLRDTLGHDTDSHGLFLTDGDDLVTVVRTGDELAGGTVVAVAATVRPDKGGAKVLLDDGTAVFSAILDDGREVLGKYTPDLHWKSYGSAGMVVLNAADRWTLGLRPSPAHRCYVASGGELLLAPVASAMSVRSLQLGGGTGLTDLVFEEMCYGIQVEETFTIMSNARINHDYAPLTAGSFLNRGSLETHYEVRWATTFENDGAVIVNELGRMISDGGSFTNRGALVLDGGAFDVYEFTNDVVSTMTARGRIDAFRRITNNGELTLTGRLELDISAGPVENYGTVNIGAGHVLDLGASLYNHSTIALAGGAITGDSGITNEIGGVISGHGAIVCSLENYGGTIRVEGGQMTVAEHLNNDGGAEIFIAADSSMRTFDRLANPGRITLAGPSSLLSVSRNITNDGTIEGAGRIETEYIDNDGTLRATGDLIVSGEINNGSTGRVEVGDATLVVVAGLDDNDGSITMAGGTLDNNAAYMTSAGTISGHGTIRTGRLTNSGFLGVGEGDMAVFGPVINNGDVQTRTTHRTVFHNAVTGAGSYPGGGEVVFLANFDPSASPAAVPVAVGFGGDVILGAAASLTADAAGADLDRLDGLGEAAIDPGASLEVRIYGGGSEFQVGTRVLIDAAGGLTGTFADVTDLGAYVSAGPNGDGLTYDEADGTVTLTFDLNLHPGDANLDGATDVSDRIVWNSHNFTVGTTFTTGDFNNDGVTDVSDRIIWNSHNFTFATDTPGPPAAATVPIPEPATMTLLALGAVGALLRRRRE